MIYVDGGVKLRTYVPANARLLDIGCGTGITVDAYRQGMNGVEIFGIDGYAAPDEVQPYIRFTKQDVDGARLPYEDNFFDVVVMNHILEHVTKPVVLINEACRVLKPSGILYLETPSLRSTRVPEMRMMNDQFVSVNFYDDFTHVGRPQTVHSLTHLLSRNGFDVIELDYARPKNWIRAGVMHVLRGLRHRKRVILATGIWHLVGWALFAVARKNDAKKVPAYV